MIEMLLSGGGGGGGVPAGTIIGFSGTLAQANTLNDWVICDGRNNTPNLNGRMIIGASGSYPFGSEGQGGRISGASGSTAGAHNPSNKLWFQAAVVGSNFGNGPESGGGHSHTLLTSTIPTPSARQTLFIQARVETQIPQYGVVWMKSVPRRGVVVDNGVFNRFLVGVTGSARGDVGNDSLTLELSTSLSGSHIHFRNSTNLDGEYTTNTLRGAAPFNATTGNHTHTVPSKTVVAVPPWYGLIPGEAEKILSPWEGLVLAYNGSLASLPAPWREFTQLRGRFPRGASNPGNTGGSTQQTVTANPGSDNFTHSHRSSLSNTHGDFSRSAAHTSYSEVHSHNSMSLTYSNLPPYKALHYITI